MIKFKNKNVERESEIRYLTYITGRSYSHNDGVKHLTNVIKKIMSNNDNNGKYLNEIVYADVIPYIYCYQETRTIYYVSVIVKRTYYKDMYESLYAFNRALEETEIKL